jgi:hypothetical protein
MAPATSVAERVADFTGPSRWRERVLLLREFLAGVDDDGGGFFGGKFGVGHESVMRL